MPGREADGRATSRLRSPARRGNPGGVALKHSIIVVVLMLLAASSGNAVHGEAGARERRSGVYHAEDRRSWCVRDYYPQLAHWIRSRDSDTRAVPAHRCMKRWPRPDHRSGSAYRAAPH